MKCCFDDSNVDELYRLYWVEKRTLEEIADFFDVHPQTIRLSVDRLGIPRRPRPLTRKDLKGVRFGQLVVLSVNKVTTKKRNVFWNCKCDCGGARICKTEDLRSGLFTHCKESHHIARHNNWRWTGFEEINGRLWTSIKQNAKSRKLELNIDLPYLWKLFLQQERRCIYSNRILIFDMFDSSNQTASLDRIDSSKGYIKGNVQWVHKDINRMKQEFTEEYFINTCKEICQHYKQ